MTAAPQKDRGPITEDCLFIGEGDSDSEFLKHLCADRNITGIQFDFAEGKDNFEEFFVRLKGRTGFHRLKGILIVGDSDDAPTERFGDLRVALKKAKLPYPETPQQIVNRNDGLPSVAILMVPFNNIGPTKGCLETVILDAVENHLSHLSQCVTDFCACVGANNWPRLTSKYKIRLRAFMSAAWKDDPNISLTIALKPQKNLVPYNNTSFNAISGYLAHFRSQL